MNGKTPNAMALILSKHVSHHHSWAVTSPSFLEQNAEKHSFTRGGQCRSNMEPDRAKPAIKLRGDIDPVSNLGGMFESLLEDPDGAEQLGNVPKVGNDLSLNTI